MAIRDNYFPGTSVSRYLPTGEHSFDQAVYQSGKPVLDSELNFDQEVGRNLSQLLLDRTIPSGWLRGPTPFNPDEDFLSGTVANTIQMVRRTATVANFPVVVEFTGTNTSNRNVITLEAAPVHGGAPPSVKRTDFLFLEVWRCVVSHSPRASATLETITIADVTVGDIIRINGVDLTAVAGAPGVDDFTIGGTEAANATNISAAVNLGTNSFTGICTATVDALNPALVNLRAADPFAGAAGNALTLFLVLGVAGAMEVNGITPGPTVFSGGADTGNKPTQATIYRHGNVAAPAGVNLADDIADPVVGTETSKRIQIQYRIRATGQTEAVNFKTENGFDNPLVEAFGATGAAVAGYPFIPADGSSVSASSSAVAYDTVDAGLWVAGDGSSAAATALGTVDGYVYAIPLAMIPRRNNAGGAGAGFDPLSNTNGALSATHPGFANPIIGAIPAGVSDRPDGRFHDAILASDVMDTRKNVVPGGLDLKAELERQMTLLLDGQTRTWMIDAADKQTLGGGSGDVGTRFLVCNEIGRSGAKGGVSPSSGDTPRGDSIADFDHIRRRFADWSVVEKRIFPIFPGQLIGTEPGLYVTKATVAYTTWQEGDVINIDLNSLDATGLGDWLEAPSGAPTGGGHVSNLFPLGTTISNVLRVIHDEGNYAASVPKATEVDQIVGVGTPHVQLALGSNNSAVNGGLPLATYDMVAPFPGADVGSPRRIWVELEITYPIGSGTTDTVDQVLAPASGVYPAGPVLEEDTVERPNDWEVLLDPLFRQSHREIAIEYVANDGSGAGSGAPISDNFVSDTSTQVRLPRRVFGSGATITTITEVSDGLTRSVDTSTTEYGSSSRILQINPAGVNGPLSGAGQSQVNVDYFAQDPLPNWGGVGYQIAVYYRSNAPQTVGVQAGAPATFPLPTTLVARPLAMSRDLWSGTVGSGSVDLAYPYAKALDQIAVSGDISAADFPGEWVLSSLANISVGNFSAATGLLTLGQMVAVDGNQDFEFSDLGADVEFRAAYKVSDPGAYRPTAMAQPLTGPATHKVFFPFLARAEEDNVYWRAGEVLLIVVSRFAIVQDNNVVAFTTLSNTTCAAVYRTRGLLLMATE